MDIRKKIGALIKLHKLSLKIEVVTGESDHEFCTSLTWAYPGAKAVIGIGVSDDMTDSIMRAVVDMAFQALTLLKEAWGRIGSWNEEPPQWYDASLQFESQGLEVQSDPVAPQFTSYGHETTSYDLGQRLRRSLDGLPNGEYVVIIADKQTANRLSLAALGRPLGKDVEQ